MTHRLLIIQPYVPAYRVPLFRQLRAQLEEFGVDMRLAAALPERLLRSRGDDRTAEEADYVLSERSFPLLGRNFRLRSVNSVLGEFKPTLVIAEQAIGNLETWRALGPSGLPGHPSVALWGQGRAYSQGQSRIERSAKQWLTNRCDWFFAYTESGADYVTTHGFPKSRVTVLGNTIDTVELKADVAGASSDEVQDFLTSLGATAGRTALFMGGVDDRKGIDFLLESAIEVERILPGFVLLVGGSGDRASDVQSVEAAGGPVRFLGRLDGRRKALALKAAQVMMIPEWVGLVAIDSLAAGCPIVTTDHPAHSPEYDYLDSGRNSLTTAHDVETYSRTVADVLRDPVVLSTLKRGARESFTLLDLSDLVERFSRGVRAWVAAGSK